MFTYLSELIFQGINNNNLFVPKKKEITIKIFNKTVGSRATEKNALEIT